MAACHALLLRAGWASWRAGAARPKVPIVLLNGQSQHLLVDLFGRADVIEGWFPIERRIVRWGGQTVDLPHAALAVDEGALLSRLGDIAASEDTGDYTIYSGKPLPDVAYGNRRAEAAAFLLNPGAARHACWIEAVEQGWLFGVGASEQQGWVLAVGGSIEELLDQSTLMKTVVGELLAGRSSFVSHPRIAEQLTGERWLACGGAAMGFDPICGEGTGHALREAILASAVLRAHAGGEPWAALAREYEARLQSGFARHLEQCRQLYASGGDSAWWKAQLAELRQPSVVAPPQGRYRLVGFDLVLVEPA